MTRSGGKGQGIVEHLSAAIRNGRYVPGQRLIEAELTAELGVSRGPVREALRRLAADGLIEIVPHRGALVRRFSRVEALELFQIRAELEALAARLAADNISDPCVSERFRRDAAVIWREDPRYSTAGYIAENQSFHAAIFQAAGNEQLVKWNRNMQLSLIMSQIHSALTAGVINSSLVEHRLIAKAILAGDSEAAAQASRAHMARATQLMLDVPDELFRRTEMAWPTGPVGSIPVTK